MTSRGSSPSFRRQDVTRRLVITVCPREAGAIALAVDRGSRKRWLDAAGVARCLRELVRSRRLEAVVSVTEGCAGGCSRSGPNVDVRIHSAAATDQVAIGWKTYVYSLTTLDCLATIIDENLHASE